MSTAIPAAALEAPVPAKEIPRPLLWLLVILALGLGLRLLHFRDASFQIDEFTTLAAVAERPGVEVGTTPTEQDPLVPVPSLAEVSNRSVIPFGIEDPVPLYHDFLWAVVHALPVAAWSVRLPSLLAGVACIAAVFFLVRRPFGNEMALVAALFVALDPIQINTSWLAQPFALADLCTVLSFAALLGLLRERKPGRAALYALGYAVCVALIGYLSALMLLVVFAHAGLVLFAGRGDAEGAARKAAGYWAAGLALGLLLLAPEFGYFFRVSSWAVAHATYLTAVNNVHSYTPLLTLIKHNLVFLGGLVLVLAAGAVIRMQLQSGQEKPEGEPESPVTDAPGSIPAGGSALALTEVQPAATAVAPAPAAEAAPVEPAAPLPENDEGLRMARLWLFLPQAALLLASLLVAAIFTTRSMTYTTLGAAILLAYYATRDGSREVRLGVAGVVALGMLLIGFWPSLSTGQGLTFLNDKPRIIMIGDPPGSGGLAGQGMEKSWKEGDVILMRPGLLEADFIRTDIPEAARPNVERAIVAPLTLLYPDSSHKPVIPLTLSQYRNQKVKTLAGDKVALETFYDADLVARLKTYRRYWMTGVANTDATPNTWYYLSCVVPWMATNLDRDLLLSRNREDPAEHYVSVKPGLGPDEPIAGLTEDVRIDDFRNFAHLVRPAEPKK